MPGAAARLGRPVFRLAALALWAYLWAVLLNGERIGGVYLGLAPSVLLFLGGCVAIVLVTRWMARHRRPAAGRMLDFGLAALSLLVAVVTADVGYSMYDNARRASASAAISSDARATDAHVWHGELFPRLYFPTQQSFGLYKPDVRLTARTYGEFYTSAMLRSPTLVDSVLQPRTITYAIGPHGVRETEPLAASRIFALGDSFVLGYATDEGKVWTDRLAAALGEPVYNLGVSSTGPRSQLQLLQYMLAANADSMHVGRLLWMIFEGNDLENDYDETRPVEEAPSRGVGALLDGTLPVALLAIPARVKSESILHRLLHGELRFGAPAMTAAGRHYEIDGVSLPVPLYHSRRWGYRFFSAEDADRATRPREYVLDHPNRPLLDRTMRDMRALSERYGFPVTVIIAPSDARLYGAAFEDFPTPSATPYFAEYVAELSRRLGFEVVDLVTQLRPYAEREMLYYRDDHHWNERGNEIAAQLIQAALARSSPVPSGALAARVAP